MVGAWIAIVILSAMAALHVCWASGGTLDKAALLIAARAGLVHLLVAGLVVRIPPGHSVFALRAIGDLRTVGFLRRVRGTRFDTALYPPLCALLALLIGDAARM